MDYEKKIGEIAQKIVDQFHPDKIILFGSYAWGTPGPNSDVDLLVISETQDTRQLARAIDGSLFPRPFPIDLMVFRPEQVEQRRQKGDFFVGEILTRGKILYAR